MTISDQFLIVLAIVFFVVAAFPPPKPAIGWQYLAFACLAATLL